MLAVKIVFWASLGLLVWTHVGYPIAAALASRLAAPPRGELGDRAERQRDRRGPQRGRRDRAARPQPARARLSGRSDRGRRRVGRFDRRDRSDRRATRRVGPSRPARPLPARRQGCGAESRRRRVERRDRRLLGRERGVAARRAAAARPQLRRSGRRLRHRPRLVRGRRRDEPRRGVLALRALASGPGIAPGLGHRGQRARSTPCGGPTGSTRSPGAATISGSRT